MEGDIDNLLTMILEFLKVYIVVLFHFPPCNKVKFLEMIDKSLNDENGSQQLIEFLKHVNIGSMRDEKIP